MTGEVVFKSTGLPQIHNRPNESRYGDVYLMKLNALYAKQFSNGVFPDVVSYEL